MPVVSVTSGPAVIRPAGAMVGIIIGIPDATRL